jgi:hypothetical protein
MIDYAMLHLDGYFAFVTMYLIARSNGGSITTRNVLCAAVGWLGADIIRWLFFLR